MKRISLLTGTALALLLTIFQSVPVFAQQQSQQQQEQRTASSSGLSITPRKNIVLEPGKSVTDKLSITNLNKNSDLQVTFKTIDFTFMNDTGTPKLLLEGNPQTAWSIKPFIKLPQSVIIPAGQSKSVDYSVTIPKGQGAGSYYSAIQYATGGSNGGNVSLSASGVSLVFVSVPGVVSEKLTIKRFGAYQENTNGLGGKFLTLATNNAPKEMAFSLQNDGNVAESPNANITINYMFGGKKIQIDDANSSKSLALRGQNRLFVTCIQGETKEVEIAGTTTKAKVCEQPKMLPGRYTANIDVFYGQNGNNTMQVSGKASFWYLPWWFIATVGVVLLALIVTILVVRRKLRHATGAKPMRRR